MSALGCLLEGDMARCHGVRIFERFNNTVMASVSFFPKALYLRLSYRSGALQCALILKKESL